MRDSISLSRLKSFSFIPFVLFGALCPVRSMRSVRKSVSQIVRDYNSNAQTIAVLFDLKTHKILDSFNEILKLTPVSLKTAVNALYGI